MIEWSGAIKQLRGALLGVAILVKSYIPFSGQNKYRLEVEVARFGKVTTRASGEAPTGRTNSSGGLLPLGSRMALCESFSWTKAVVAGLDPRVFIVSCKCWCRRNVASMGDATVDKVNALDQSANACRVILADARTVSTCVPNRKRRRESTDQSSRRGVPIQRTET